MSMEIMQMLQVIPQAAPTTGTVPEAPAGSAATPDLFASLMAGLLVQPPATATTELPSLSTVETQEPSDQAATARESDDIATAETAMMSLASLVVPQTIVQQVAPVTEIPPQTVATIEANTAIPATQVTATAVPPAPVPEMATAMAPAPASEPASAPVMLPSQPPKADAPIPLPELPPDTPLAQTPVTEAPKDAPAPQAAAQPEPVKNGVEVLTVSLEPAKTTEAVPANPRIPTSEPVPKTAPEVAVSDKTTQEVAVAEKPAPRTLGPTAAYPDRIPVIPKGEHSPVAAERGPVTETARQTETVHLAGVKPQEVEVVVKGEAGEEYTSGDQGKGGSQTPDMKGHVAPVQTDAAKSFEPTLQGTTKPEHQPTHGLRDSIMAQVKEGIATREPARNGEISIRLAPAELGELRINVRVVDQQVKVEVLAANSQVREILLNNLDSLKENFSRQNLTMSGFDVSTGTGQGYEQLFRQGREASQQGGFRTSYQRGTGEDDTPSTEAAASYYYTDRRDSILDVRL